MDVQDVIRKHGAVALCRAAGDYAWGGCANSSPLALDGCENMRELLGIVRLAYDALQEFQRPFFAPILREIEELALIEAALAVR